MLGHLRSQQHKQEAVKVLAKEENEIWESSHNMRR
jgi:hypothetical protein